MRVAKPRVVGGDRVLGHTDQIKSESYDQSCSIFTSVTGDHDTPPRSFRDGGDRSSEPKCVLVNEDPVLLNQVQRGDVRVSGIGEWHVEPERIARERGRKRLALPYAPQVNNPGYP